MTQDPAAAAASTAAYRAPAPGGAYTSRVAKQAGAPADEAVKASSSPAAPRHFRSAVFSASQKLAAAATPSETSSGAAMPSSSKRRSLSTPRSGGSVAVPGRPRIVQPGSSSSSSIAAKRLTSQGPLASALAGQKQAGSTRRLVADANNIPILLQYVRVDCKHAKYIT